VLSNVWLVVAHRRAARHSRDLGRLLAAGVIGAVAGTVLLTRVDARWLSVVLAALILLYVSMRIVTPHFSLNPAVSGWSSPPVGLVAGGLQGATGVSGPLLSTYLHAFALTPSAYVFSLSSLFLVFSITQVTTLASLGAYSPQLIAEGFLALVPVAVLLPLGSWFTRRLDARTFSTIVMIGLVAAATVLVWQAVRG
jgi:hypothetical protein